MTEKRPPQAWNLSTGSILAEAAFDFLRGGETLFGLVDGWRAPELVDWARDKRVCALVAFLRSEEPLPAEMRAALADAIDPDPEIDAPLKLDPRRPKRTSPLTAIRRNAQSVEIFQAYNSLKEKGMTADDAIVAAAVQVGIGESEARDRLSEAYARRELQFHKNDTPEGAIAIDLMWRSAWKPGSVTAEDVAAALRPLGERPRKRGRKPTNSNGI